MSNQPWEAVGLTASEYQLISEHLSRAPNPLELGIYGLMWSEHCSYKSSRKYLAQLPTEGPQVLQGPGENAGVVDIGEDTAVAFRIESHNHPSAIEPVQGAATGVGGILRDIFAMGARPVALLDSLRFGDLQHPRVRHLFEGVVQGISWYGNCVGVPTVGGEIYFDDAYRDNPLVNVMCVGLVEKSRLMRGEATGVGNSVLLVGASTGRDGIHGASLLASREFEEEPEDMRPAVQVGDPFREKLLIEACLEVLESDAVVGLNDLGAAGLASACSETASRGGSGMRLDVGQVPRRESNMTPYEVMLSESQERMLVIVQVGREQEIIDVFDRWGLQAVPIGEVTDTGFLQIFDGAEAVACIPVTSLTDGAPAYDRPVGTLPIVPTLSLEEVPEPQDYDDVMQRMVSHPNLCSRRYVFQQYDHMVGTNTVLRPGADAALIRIKGTPKGVAAVTDGNGMLCALDPYQGAGRIVAECYRNLSAVGATPLAITNCLNFGSPERPEIMASFVQVLEGMGEACRQLDTPVTGGNVSFYNETRTKEVYPTPVIGMVGRVDDVSQPRSSAFQATGDQVVLLGAGGTELGASQYLNIIHDRVMGPVTPVDFSLERRLGDVCRQGLEQGLLRSAHDVSDGGLAVALAECAALSDEGWGARVELAGDVRPDVALFAEDGSRMLVTVTAADWPALQQLAESMDCPAERVGVVGGERLQLLYNEESLVDVSVRDLVAGREGGLT